MQLSLNWLKQVVDLDGISPQTIAERLTCAGLEIEGMHTTGGAFHGVLVGRIIAVDPHPNADRLRLVTVDLGREQALQVVCGAPNVAVGLWIAFAPTGASVFSPKQNAMFTLTPATIRGIASEGMICSLDELGLLEQFTKTSEGIWELNAVLGNPPDDSPLLGQPLREALGLTPDTILESAPTVNRGDLMAVTEVARELSILFDRPLSVTSPPALPAPVAAASGITVAVQDQAVCPNYWALIVDHVTIKSSPGWMQQALLASGIKPCNNVVDITNYVMLALGQPIHAFDCDTLPDHCTLSVRHATSDDTLTTLDDTIHLLSGDNIVITANDQPVALAGVMGGLTSRITDHTTRLLIESAYFRPVAIRRSAKRAGMRTEASARYERGVDPQGCERVLAYTAQLLQEHANATGLAVLACQAPPVQPTPIRLRTKRVEQLLGVALSTVAISDTLRQLGFAIDAQADGFNVNVPSRRWHDITREIDLIEELGRIHGFDQISSTLPTNTCKAQVSGRQVVLQSVQSLLQGVGFQEWVTPSLLGDALWQRIGLGSCLSALRTQQTVEVLKAHSVDHTILRQSLLPSLLDTLRGNIAQGQAHVWAYEMGRSYHCQAISNVKNTGVTETLHVAGVLLGQPTHWLAQQPPNFYTAKGVLERLLTLLPIHQQSAVSFTTFTTEFLPVNQVSLYASLFHPGRTALIMKEDALVGFVGEVHPIIQAQLKATSPIYAFQLAINDVFASLWQDANPLALGNINKPSPYQSVNRDVAFLAPLSVSHSDINKVLQSVLANNTILQSAIVFDDYRGENLPDGCRSLAYRFTLQSATETLTDAIIEATMQPVKDALAHQLAVQYR
jgi:phenylalanyl-tRNA synthetase beta chain